MAPPTPAPARPRLPHHREDLREDLRKLGVCEGDVVLVHASLRQLGFVVGGAVTVVQSLLDVLGTGGTIVVPTFTANNSDPSRWAQTCRRPVPSEWWPVIRDHMPAFDRALTPSFNVGVVAETVRTWPGSVRSGHPQTSFSAIGPAANELMASHAPDCHLGPQSPLGALERTDAKVVLLGVSFAACTAFHLAEYRLAAGPRREYECVIRVDGERRWFRYHDVLLDDSDFGHIGAAYETSDTRSSIRQGVVGCADSRLFPVSAAVAFADAWMQTNRIGSTPSSPAQA